MAVISPISALGSISGLASAGGVGSTGSASSAAPMASAGLSSPGITATAPTAGAPGSAATGSSQSFLDTLGNSFGQLNQQLVTADASVADFAAGGSSDLHTVMLQMQEASLGLQMGVQVRDKFLEAYQEIMRLQV